MAHIRDFKAFHEYNSYYPYYLPSYYSNMKNPSEYSNVEGANYTRYYEPITLEEFSNLNSMFNGTRVIILFLIILIFLYIYNKK
jgi:hypothetical protein